jgi:hypothetical protein
MHSYVDNFILVKSGCYSTLSENYEEPILQIYQWDKAQFQLINNSQINVVMVTTIVAMKCIICQGLIRRGRAKRLSQVLWTTIYFILLVVPEQTTKKYEREHVTEFVFAHVIETMDEQRIVLGGKIELGTDLAPVSHGFFS